MYKTSYIIEYMLYESWKEGKKRERTSLNASLTPMTQTNLSNIFTMALQSYNIGSSMYAYKYIYIKRICYK